MLHKLVLERIKNMIVFSKWFKYEIFQRSILSLNHWEFLRFKENSLNFGSTNEKIQWCQLPKKKLVVPYWLKLSGFSLNLRDSHWFKFRVYYCTVFSRSCVLPFVPQLGQTRHRALNQTYQAQDNLTPSQMTLILSSRMLCPTSSRGVRPSDSRAKR